MGERGGLERSSLVAGLGIAQLIAWGTLYYAIAVTAEPLQRALGISNAAVYGAFCSSLAVAGALTPLAGHLVDRLGGRTVLAASCLCGAAGLALLANAQSWPQLLLAHAINGVAMALGLYEACFGALAQVLPGSYRRSVTALVLIGGLASTVFWPLTHQLVTAFGVRCALLAYAGLQLGCLALYVVLLPPRTSQATAAPSEVRPAPTTPIGRLEQAAIVAAFAVATGVGAAINAHLLAALQTLDLDRGQAAWLAAAVGICQVLGRATELRRSHLLSGLQLGAFSLFALATAMAWLVVGRGATAAWGFVVMFGASNGLLTIAKALIPLELFGNREAGRRLAGFAWPSLVARAAAPLALAQLSSTWGLRAGLAATLVAAILAALGCAFTAGRFATRIVAAPF